MKYHSKERVFCASKEGTVGSFSALAGGEIRRVCSGVLRLQLAFLQRFLTGLISKLTPCLDSELRLAGVSSAHADSMGCSHLAKTSENRIPLYRQQGGRVPSQEWPL